MGEKMLILRDFTNKDIEVLQKNKYPRDEDDSILHKIELWNSKDYDGKYYEMFAVVDDNMIIGMVSLYHHTKNIISCGPEIFEKYRRQGYGNHAMRQVLSIARDKGYKIAVAQVRKDNLASIRLHEKLGFEMDHEYINKRGNEVCFYIKYIGE